MILRHRITEMIKNADSTTFCKGRVKIHKNNKLLIDTSNHIVISGRHWLMQRMFGLPFDLSTQQQEWLPNWFSVGSGGASMDNPFQPVWPTDNDIDLFNPLSFNTTGGARYSSDYIKKMIDGVSFESALTTKVTMTLGYDDCAGQYINEAGVFISPTTENTETNFTMFSHVTFPTIPKSNLVELLIEWYFIF